MVDAAKMLNWYVDRMKRAGFVVTSREELEELIKLKGPDYLKMKIADLPDFDPAEYLKTEEDVAAYLTCILEENDASLLASADLVFAARMNALLQIFRLENIQEYIFS